MNSLIWPSISFYCAFSFFVFYQQRAAKEFKGANRSIPLVLSLTGFLGMLVSFIYLVYYAWNISWWAAIIAFVMSPVISGAGALLEQFVPAIWIALIGLIAGPICAYLMFSNIK